MADAATIAKALHGTRNGNGFLCRCPAPSHGKGRGDRSPSLSVSDGDDGRLLFHCFSGCDSRDVLAELRRRGIMEGGNRSYVERKPRPKPIKIEPNPDALALWSKALQANETKAQTYLRARGLTGDVPPSLRFLPAYEHIAGRVYLPALIAALQAGDRRVIGVQITMLDPRGDRKAQVRFPRKTIGAMHDGAVRLAAASDVLGLAEGIETGLSAMRLFGVPTWCCLGAARMHSVAIPDSVQELHLFADGDEAGEAAIQRTAETHRRRRIIVHRPLSPGQDFNDALRGLPEKECA